MSVTFFLQLDSIPGDSSDPGHTGWFELTSFSWAPSQTSPAGTPGVGPGKARITEFAFTARSGPHTPRLVQACNTGFPLRFAVLEVVRSSGAVDYRARFNDLLIKSCSVSPDGPTVVSCTVSFSDIQFEHGSPQPTFQRAQYRLIRAAL